ncbi:hypothetical protein MRB53_017587 [Persea americana]|uniref:Uncharacterized protein n=1 Tax=Persea americana TaxID=3435 RepID=A0ACC2M638_PERAE|nr:hypothetical protein MRB53_017587 [Persea americana]
MTSSRKKRATDETLRTALSRPATRHGLSCPQTAPPCRFPVTRVEMPYEGSADVSSIRSVHFDEHYADKDAGIPQVLNQGEIFTQ